MKTMLCVLLLMAGTAFGQSLTVNQPSPSDAVTSPFVISASAADCGGEDVVALGWSLDTSVDAYTCKGQSMEVTGAASQGSHTLRVKAWSAGHVCVTDIPITVTPDAGPQIPEAAVSVGAIEKLSWNKVHDSATGTSSTGAMSMVVSPSKDGNSRKFVTTYRSGGGERYSVDFGDDENAANFVYDGWVYLPAKQPIANLEMDLNQVLANGQTMIYAFQCSGNSGVWEYGENAGTPAKHSAKWVESKATCNPAQWTPDVWHHVQIESERDDDGNVKYDEVWLDGAESQIDAVVPGAFALGWSPGLSTNFQVDGKGASGTVTAYLDDFTVYRW